MPWENATSFLHSFWNEIYSNWNEFFLNNFVLRNKNDQEVIDNQKVVLVRNMLIKKGYNLRERRNFNQLSKTSIKKEVVFE